MEKNTFTLKLVNREILISDGVKDVLSFSDSKVSILTCDGVMTVSGKGLQIKKFGSEETAEISGRINSVVFSEGNISGKSIFAKLVK